MYYLRDWFLTKKTEKTADWGNRVVRFCRMNMQPLISLDQAETGMSYLLGKQDLTFIKNLFQNTTKINLTNEKRLFDPLGRPIHPHDGHNEFMNTEMSEANFKPLPLLQKMFRINVAEMKKMGPIVNVRSNDPTSTEQRKKDEALLKNKKLIEKDLTDIHTAIGQKPVSIDHYQDRFGEKPDSGNVSAFKSMGLDDGDPADINQFMQHFHKLDQEIAAQDVIDYCMLDNQVTDKMENWVTDGWAKNAMCAAVHVSDVNGKPTYDYLAPETVWIYGGGRRRDYNDANAKAYQQKISIKELLDRFGNSFDFEKDWDKLIMAISFAGNAIEFTDIKPSWQGLLAGETYATRAGAGVGLNNFLSFKVTVGYIEWSSQNQETFGETEKDNDGGFFENNQPPNGERYQTKARFETPTYKAFYLAVSSIDQVLFNFGEMTYQQIEGYSDFNTNFSIVTWKEIGEPLAIMAIPFLDVIHEAWFKWKYEIRRAKPRGTEYNYESILKIAEDIFIDTELTRDAKFQKIISFLDSSANSISAIPLGEDGKPLTNAPLSRDLPNGLSPEVKLYWDIIVGTMDEMQDVLTGRAPLRQGDPGGSRDSMNNQFKALEYSQNATYYIPDMLTYLFQQLASKTMLFVQDIIQFKNHNTLAYNYLLDAVGEEAVSKINGLGKKAMHRYGIFIESLNQTAQRAKLSARIDFALQNGKITNAQALLVEDIKSPIKAFLWLAYFEEKTDKAKLKSIMAAEEQKQQGAQQQMQSMFQLEKMKGDFMIQKAQIDADAQMQGHIITQKGGITKTAMKHSSDVEQIEAQAQADLAKEQGSIDTMHKVNPPPPAPMPQGPPPQQQRPQSAIAQQMQQAIPTNTSAAPV